MYILILSEWNCCNKWQVLVKLILFISALFLYYGCNQFEVFSTSLSVVWPKLCMGYSVLQNTKYFGLDCAELFYSVLKSD